MQIRVLYIVMSLVVMMVSTGCQKPHENTKIVRPVIRDVELRQVLTSNVAEHHDASGSVAALTVSAVSSRVMGTVDRIHVKEGDKVTRGMTLLTIDARDLAEKVRAAEGAYNEAMKALKSATEQKELAEKTYERYRKLYDDNALTDQELDNMATSRKVAQYEYQRVQSMVEQAEAGMKEARVYQGFAAIKSPVDGIVSKKMIDPGSMANPGVPLMIIEDNSVYRLEANVDESLLHSVVPGMKARVSIPSLGKDVEGAVVEVVPTVDPLSRTFQVKIELQDANLRSGQYGKVRFITGQKQSLLVPISAVVNKGQLSGVYRLNQNNVVTYRLVKVGRTHGDMVEVLSGIESGDTIVVDNVGNAIDGGVLEGSSSSTAQPAQEK